MQAVELERGVGVDEAEQFVLGEEVAGHVDVAAAPGQGRGVLDLGAGQVPEVVSLVAVSLVAASFVVAAVAAARQAASGRSWRRV